MRLDDRARSELLGARALKRLLVGTVIAALLLGAQDNGKPWHAACWLSVGAILGTLTEAYGTHLSTHRDERIREYLRGLAWSIVYESTFVVACLPTLLFLVLAAAFHWRDDHQNANGSWTVGYTTIGLNMNVILLFILGIAAARRGGFGLRWVVVFGVINACLGLAIVNVDLELR
jgi:hypothetical protein